MSGFVYHYTDTARLPWILLDGKLKPGRNRLGSFPDPEFLWATISPIGDRTSSASMETARSGLTRLVRFAMHAKHFETWPAVVSRFPAWTPEQVKRLEFLARGKSSPQDWRCRSEPLPVEAWICIETRSYTDKIWRPLPMPWRVIPFENTSAGIQIGEKVYVSTAVVGPTGNAGYGPTVMNA